MKTLRPFAGGGSPERRKRMVKDEKQEKASERVRGKDALCNHIVASVQRIT